MTIDQELELQAKAWDEGADAQARSRGQVVVVFDANPYRIELEERRVRDAEYKRQQEEAEKRLIEESPFKMGDRIEVLQDAEFSWGEMKKGYQFTLRRMSDLRALNFSTALQYFKVVDPNG